MGLSPTLMRGHRIGLSAAQMQALKRLSRFAAAHGFYLAGGTALTIRLGHRRSVDLDYFTEREFDAEQLSLKLGRIDGFNLNSVANGTIHGSLLRVKVSFLRYDYPNLEEADHWSPFRTDIASVMDLFTMKLSAIGGRGAKKDFIDIYAILERGWSLADGLEAYRDKFGQSDSSHLMRSLLWFDDADREPTPQTLWDMDWRTVKRVIREAVNEAS
jgi:hypothetical protein